MSIDLSVKIFCFFCISLITLFLVCIFLLTLKDDEKNKVKVIKIFPKYYLDFLQSSWWNETEKKLDQSNYIESNLKNYNNELD